MSENIGESMSENYETQNGYVPGVQPDPWIHRSSGMQCRTCMWYAEKQSSQHESSSKQLGRCRRHAPTMNGYPVVFPNDWCGDHKIDENKL